MTDATPAAPAKTFRCTQTVTLVEKARINEPGWQLMLRTADDAGLVFFCPCGLPLEPYFDQHARGHNVRALPRQRELHHDHCPVVSQACPLQPLHTQDVCYTDAIFFADVKCIGQKILGGKSRNDRIVYGDFAHLFNAAFIRAYLRAVRALNQKAGIALPDCYQHANEIRAALEEPLMADGTSPFDTAARNGIALYWGVATKPLVRSLHASRYDLRDEILSFVQCWGRSGVMDWFYVAATIHVADLRFRRSGRKPRLMMGDSYLTDVINSDQAMTPGKYFVVGLSEGLPPRRRTIIADMALRGICDGTVNVSRRAMG